MNNKVIAHIVGINNVIKKDFVKRLKNKYKNIAVYDLDPITLKIRETKTYVRLSQEIKSSHVAISIKALKQELYDFWIDEFRKYITKTLEAVPKKKSNIYRIY